MAGPIVSAPLPIDAVLGDVRNALRTHGTGVLVAAPGAGKTTRVPLALLDEPWRDGGKIVVLEPRRIAARAAAERLAATLGTRLGDRVGLRARLASKTSANVAIEVVTEGVFTRMILDDPELSGVAAVLFDEFHERSLDADLGLALALDTRGALRPDLKILVMSATLEASRVAKLLGDAPVIASDGRTFPIETRHIGRRAQRIEDDVVDAVRRALERDTGSILVFLPGQGEITRVAERLRALDLPETIDIAPLYGALDPATQDRAISPANAGHRKIVLATSIAETSITIEGVRVVIDSGLARVPRFEPDVGVTRLETVRVSRASADQRRGRAGRTEPGICYRLWDEPETQGLVPFAEPEIRVADLSSLLLDCAEWGTNDPRSLAWLDPPSEGALSAARSGLQAIGALDAEGHITQEGRRLRALPLPPRLARMLLKAGERGAAEDAAELAAVLVERGIGGNDLDIATRLENFRRDRSRRSQDMRALARQWARAATTSAKGDTLSPAELLALAYPERIAKNRGKRGSFLLANGRAGLLDTAHPLAGAPYLVVAELQGRAAATRIMLATATDEAEVSVFAGDRIASDDALTFDRDSRSVKARSVRRLGAIELRSESRPVRPDEDSAPVLANGVAQLGIGNLPWSKAQLQLRNRVGFLRANDESWPDLSDAALAAAVGEWLQPFLSGKTRVSEIDASTLEQALTSVLPWPIRQRLDAEAPTHFEAPTGNSHALDYESAAAPALHIRVQELFGLKEHPAIARGRLPLTLYLLSPAHRPIQITRDLPGFWAGSWAAVKADMRGQYPKHVWPDDPANATPTSRAKPRGK
ncbi:ATP-dependent helicase HrpB [Hyphomicrobium denitrificans ATCC 51888]|uniref:ATP-dependent helicase HrpB n=1 Tax=Hyphomicrobium denitrificans (strain ATCC 51888 / DSM 1869 / NCIMB 11706 / TK 0415) TaxID=582899 RepID=D8JW44_HYPDA|nr:ATP-dependent helicase HrpB [Hyphomicrobium denitrificans]ADJ24923.1 ATP-dependent helicase HrpB [Hyphomicrobium denitrificans ATCC 51888]